MKRRDFLKVAAATPLLALPVAVLAKLPQPATSVGDVVRVDDGGVIVGALAPKDYRNDEWSKAMWPGINKFYGEKYAVDIAMLAKKVI